MKIVLDMDEKNTHVYDVITGKEITSISEIFKDGVDYENLLKDIKRFENNSPNFEKKY